MGKILAAVIVGHNPGRALEDLDSSAGYAPQLWIHSGTLGLSKSLTKWHQYLACSFDSDFCKAVISASTREIQEKEVNRNETVSISYGK